MPDQRTPSPLRPTPRPVPIPRSSTNHAVGDDARSPLIRPACLLLSLALCLLVLEGAFRKWVLRSEAGISSCLAYFSKDLAFAALVLLPAPPFHHPALLVFRKWLFRGTVLFVCGAALGATNRINPVGAALTLRSVLLLPWLAWLAIPRLRSVPIRWLAVLLGLLTLLNSALATFQNHLPREHFLNRYTLTDAPVVALDSGVRATGTFSYITGLEILSSVGVWAGLVSLALAREDWKHRALGVVFILAGFACGLASISRAPLLIGIGMLAGWLCLQRQRAWSRRRPVIALSLLALAAVMWSGGVLSELARLGTAVWERHQDGGDTTWERVFGQVGVAWDVVWAAPLGVGLGTEQIGGNYAANHTLAFTTFESQFPRLVMETGALGALGFIVIAVGAIVSLQRARHLALSPRTRSAILATQLLLIPLFYAGVVFNHITSAFVWMLFAAIMAAGCAKSTL